LDFLLRSGKQTNKQTNPKQHILRSTAPLQLFARLIISCSMDQTAESEHLPPVLPPSKLLLLVVVVVVVVVVEGITDAGILLSSSSSVQLRAVAAAAESLSASSSSLLLLGVVTTMVLLPSLLPSLSPLWSWSSSPSSPALLLPLLGSPCVSFLRRRAPTLCLRSGLRELSGRKLRTGLRQSCLAASSYALAAPSSVLKVPRYAVNRWCEICAQFVLVPVDAYRMCEVG
jgi:hypothetical protein